MWGTIVALVVLLVAGALIKSETSKTLPITPVIEGERAVVVPTQDMARTVVVPPCGTNANVTASAATNLDVPGTLVFELPAGQGLRDVFIPRCNVTTGGTTGLNPFPAAAFVRFPGTPVPTLPPFTIGSSNSSVSSEGSAGISSSLGGSSSLSASSSSFISGSSLDTASAGTVNSAQFQIKIPPNTPIKTIVVAPCEKSTPSSISSEIPLTANPGTTTAVAPAC